MVVARAKTARSRLLGVLASGHCCHNGENGEKLIGIASNRLIGTTIATNRALDWSRPSTTPTQGNRRGSTTALALVQRR